MINLGKSNLHVIPIIIILYHRNQTDLGGFSMESC